jgi:4'-phosphopantetheinyl transferase
MTDRAGWAITVTSPVAGVRLGVDLELVEPRSPAFVRDWFTPSEQDLVAAARDDEDTMVRANLIWSAKESALKVLQTGLRRDTRTVEVDLDTAGDADVWQPLVVTAVEGDVMPGWWRRFGQFLLTVAAEADVAVPEGLEPDVDGRLSGAFPIHSWLKSPTVRPEPTAVPDGNAAGPARAPQAGRSAQ